jgi:hypothetical protein
MRIQELPVPAAHASPQVSYFQPDEKKVILLRLLFDAAGTAVTTAHYFATDC